jgi:hypothetical protein
MRVNLFDTIAGIDQGIDIVLPIPNVSPQEVDALVQDALFSRAPTYSTAFWVGGRDHRKTLAVFSAVVQAMVSPFVASVALDPSGANTTAAAVVSILKDHVSPNRGSVYIIGGSGMVGQSVLAMASREGYRLVVASLHPDRMQQVSIDLAERYKIAAPDVLSLSSPLPNDVAAVIAAGPPGVEVFRPDRLPHPVDILIDVNAVPPSGIFGVQPSDRGCLVADSPAWGALALGARKMKIHHKLLASLFLPSANAYDAMEIFELAKKVTEPET